MLQACADLYAAGSDINFKKVQAGSGQIVDLPSYPWQRRRHWIPVRKGRASQTARIDHPLLGQRTQVVGIEASLYQADSASAPGWLADHRIGDRVLVPAAGEMEAFCAAGSCFLGKPIEIVGFTIHRPLAVQPDAEAPVSWQVVVKKTEGGRAELEWHASETDSPSDAGSWQSIATAIAQPVDALASRLPEPAAAATVPIDPIYAQFSELGAQFGASFRCLRQVERADGFARASIEFSSGDPVDQYMMHPSLIDAALQLCLVAIGGDAGRVLPNSLHLPLGADRIMINPGPHRSLVARARRSKGCRRGQTRRGCLGRDTGRRAGDDCRGDAICPRRIRHTPTGPGCGKSLPRRLGADFQFAGTGRRRSERGSYLSTKVAPRSA